MQHRELTPPPTPSVTRVRIPPVKSSRVSYPPKYDIVISRFNPDTWKSHCEWKQRTGTRGCVYCAPIPIRDDIAYRTKLFVIELDIVLNKIYGIGLIRNNRMGRAPNKYDMEYRNYSRYGYKGTKRVDVADIENQVMIGIFEHLACSGKSHLKRGCGISLVPNWWLTNPYMNFIHELCISMGIPPPAN